MSLSTREEPRLACSLSVTVPAAVVRTVVAVPTKTVIATVLVSMLMVVVMMVMVVVATAVKATIGSDLRAGNRNRGLAARASHTPRVLPGPSALTHGYVHLGQLASGRQEAGIVY